ncbi:hypothetical protein Tcan_01094, partial [Toxocara canis]
MKVLNSQGPPLLPTYSSFGVFSRKISIRSAFRSEAGSVNVPPTEFMLTSRYSTAFPWQRTSGLVRTPDELPSETSTRSNSSSCLRFRPAHATHPDVSGGPSLHEPYLAKPFDSASVAENFSLPNATMKHMVCRRGS